MNILNIVKNNFHRALGKKFYILITLTTTFFSILLAVYFTSQLKVTGNIAFVTDKANVKVESKYINVTVLKNAPNRSELVMNKYDAVVTDEGYGKFKIDTIRNDKFKKDVIKVLKHQGKVSIDSNSKRGPGTNVLGFFMMFAMIQSVIYMSFFVEDKELGNFKRIVSSSVSNEVYLMGQSLFCFIMIFVPAMVVLVVEKELLGVNIGFSYGKYSLLLTLMILMGIAVSLFMNSLSENYDNCVMLGTAIFILTSILSGSFVKIDGSNKFLNSIISIIPQKNYLTLVQGIEDGKSIIKFLPELSYIIILSVVLFTLGIVLCKKRFNEGSY